MKSDPKTRMTTDLSDPVSSVSSDPRLSVGHSWFIPSAYLLMLASAAAFATMSACSHSLAARCDWRLVAVARGGIAFVLTAWLARAGGVRVLFRWPKTLWLRSAV